MDKEVILAIIGIATSLIVVLKFVLNQYFKLANAHEEKKHSFALTEIEKLKITLDEFAEKLTKYESAQKIQIDKINNLHNMINGYVEMMKRFFDIQNEKMKNLESTVVSLGKDVSMIKSRKV